VPRLLLVSLFLIGLAAACVSESATPTGELAILPTRVVFPSNTPTDRPTRTPLPTSRPLPAYVPIPSSTPTAIPSPTPVVMVELVIAILPIPAGMPIPPEAVTYYAWPEAALPYAAITRLEEAINQVALVDIGCFEPLLANTLAPRTVGSEFLPLPDSCPPLYPLPAIPALVNRVVAAQDIPAGSTIGPQAVILRPWPETLLPADALTSFGVVVGRTATVDIWRGQPLRSAQIRP